MSFPTWKKTIESNYFRIFPLNILIEIFIGWCVIRKFYVNLHLILSRSNMIQNPAALDSDGNLVLAKNAVKHKDYHCVTCNGRMRLAGGDNTQMQLHFRHVDTKGSHPFTEETFLHDYAKHYVARQIETSDEFDVGYWVSEICCNDDCPLNNFNCSQNVIISENIKKYYDSVQIEEWHRGFKPDILITGKRFEKDPIFIEIDVTHECDLEKIHSGIRIIEIKLPRDFNPEDLSLPELIENRNGFQYKNGIEIKFYNFKKKHQIKADKPFDERMHKKLKAIVHREDGSTPIWTLDCYEYGKKMRRDNVAEVQFAIEDDKFKYTSAKAVAFLNGIPCKDCRLCSFAEEYTWSSKCRCSKTKQEITSGRAAESCVQYKLNRYNALKWASKFDAHWYIILDKAGNKIIPANVERELREVEGPSYSLSQDEDLPY